MIEKLADVTIIGTQGTADIQEGTQFIAIEPIRCIAGTDEGISMIEEVGGKADAFCDYTYAPAKSIRTKARTEGLGS